MGGSDSRPYIRFALISLCALVFLGAVLAFYSLRRTGIDREAATAHAISGTIGEGVFAALPSAQGMFSGTPPDTHSVSSATSRWTLSTASSHRCS